MEERMRKPLLRYIEAQSRIDYAAMDEESKQIIREVGVRNMFIQNRLSELMQRLDAEGIPSIVLKGAHLTQNTYPFGIRPIEDIDILIDILDFDKAEQILHGMGYGVCDVGIGRWANFTLSNKITYSTRTQPVIPIDVHFTLGPYPYLGALKRKLLFENTESLETQNGERITVLQPEVLLIHLCLHLFQHHFEDWQVSCCDIVAVIRQHHARIDWKKFERMAEAQRLRLPVAYSLQKACELADMKIPVTWLHRDGEAEAGYYEKWVFRSSAAQRHGFDRFFIQYVTTPGIVLKLKCALQMIYPGNLFLKLHYQGSYLKYMVSASKIAFKGITAIFIKR